MRLNIGSGPNVFPSTNWINYDREDISTYLNYLRGTPDPNGMPPHQQQLTAYLQAGGAIDFRVHDLRKGFAQHADNSVEAIYLGQVIEHLNPIYEVPALLRECHRMLRPGGVLRITTPDFELLLRAYLTGTMARFAHEQPAFYEDADAASQLAYIMFGAAGPACTCDHYEGHMFVFTQTSMRLYLTATGFTRIDTCVLPGLSNDPLMAKEAVDAGMSHSFITEAVK